MKYLLIIVSVAIHPHHKGVPHHNEHRNVVKIRLGEQRLADQVDGVPLLHREFQLLNFLIDFQNGVKMGLKWRSNDVQMAIS